jgi:hypothetical protein
MMMKTNEHPITPPPELVKKIFGDALRGSDGQHTYELRLIHAAYAAGADQQLKLDAERIQQSFQAGADMELEAMLAELKALHLPDGYAAKLRAARRPKPPSLKEQALAVLMALEIDEPGYEGTYNTIRRALETLDD